MMRLGLMTGATFAATSLSMDQFKVELNGILDAIEGGEPFLTVKNKYAGLLERAKASEDIRQICPEYFFSSPQKVRSLRDIRSLVSTLLTQMEGEDMPQSQNEAPWTHIMADLSPRAADMVSRDAKRVSDPPEPKKKK